jgi:hypothetical protein
MHSKVSSHKESLVRASTAYKIIGVPWFPDHARGPKVEIVPLRTIPGWANECVDVATIPANGARTVIFHGCDKMTLHGSTLGMTNENSSNGSQDTNAGYGRHESVKVVTKEGSTASTVTLPYV